MTLKTMINLEPFCDPYSGRYALGQPWIKDDWIYATDGRVLVRCQPLHCGTDYVEANSDGSKHPKAHELLVGIEDVPQWGKFVVPDCGNCNNTDLFKDTCSECDGAGECECTECGHFGICSSCDGSGSWEEFCDCHSMNEVNGHTIAAKYLYRINELPEVEWQMSPAKAEDGLFFRWRFGDGKVMPLTTTWRTVASHASKR